MSAPDDAPQIDFKDTKSFAYTTIRERMPVILSKVVDDVHNTVRLASDDPEKASEVKEAMAALNMLTGLKYEMQTSKPLRPLKDNLEDVGFWNAEIASFPPGLRWYEATWLFAECYMYRRIREALAQSSLLNQHDPFAGQKEQSYTCSVAAMEGLAKFLSSDACRNRSLDASAFELLLQFDLWGNRSDLSLFTDFDGSENSLSHLLASEHTHLEERKHKILVDHTERLWKLVQSFQASGGKRIDVVLDNAGFELFSDLCFCEWLIDANCASKIVFHAKCMPWFVSDTMPSDVTWLLEWLGKQTSSALQDRAKRWASLLQTNVWELKPHFFWTLPHSFRRMKVSFPQDSD